MTDKRQLDKEIDKTVRFISRKESTHGDWLITSAKEVMFSPVSVCCLFVC